MLVSYCAAFQTYGRFFIGDETSMILPHYCSEQRHDGTDGTQQLTQQMDVSHVPSLVEAALVKYPRNAMDQTLIFEPNPDPTMNSLFKHYAKFFVGDRTSIISPHYCSEQAAT